MLVPAFVAFLLTQALPVVKIERDDTPIMQSCRIEIAPNVIIEDVNNDGVLHIRASDIVVEFADGSVLRGAANNLQPDTFHGIGVRIDGQKNVTLRGARLSGYFCGVWASDADGLTVEKLEARDLRRDRLGSTPKSEDSSDWLWPHSNDEHEWRTRYGAAICVERSKNCTIRECRVREAQNGLILDRVEDSRIYDNDFSFLSGWGIALWRSSRNVISRNAVDFCARGYSHGVYNRGQDSAGFLVFEQCCDNLFAENSGTHSGDGFFGFAGNEALGEKETHEAEWYRRRGNNDNLLIGNDFSYAPAHGIEMTFSFGNRFIQNRLAENAICGVWGGYSHDTLISGNEFVKNGDGSYGLERGGVNIEHGRGNQIVHNHFSENRCAVHLWWDPDAEFQEKPWGKANGTASTKNLIAGNTLDGDALAYHLRGPSDVTLGPNRINTVDREMDKTADAVVTRETDMQLDPPAAPIYTALGDKRPVGARAALRGRQNIIMGEWGPWDHESPLMRFAGVEGMSHIYEFFGWPDQTEIKLTGAGVRGEKLTPTEGALGWRYRVTAENSGVFAYSMEAGGNGPMTRVERTLVAAEWNCVFFAWEHDADPRQNVDAWRAVSKRKEAVSITLPQLSLKFGGRGPSDLKLSEKLTSAKLGRDNFGLIAHAGLPLSAGEWEFVTTSDDGVRVIVDGQVVIDNWTWHAPTRDVGKFKLDAAKTVDVSVEYFELSGHAELELSVRPVSASR